MFKTPFNFDGRIRRTEYGFTLIVFVIGTSIIQKITENIVSLEILNLLNIPAYWFIAAQGVKRCHDINKEGWYQVIPFYGFILLFSNGTQGENGYGADPKERTTEVV